MLTLLPRQSHRNCLDIVAGYEITEQGRLRFRESVEQRVAKGLPERNKPWH